MILRDLADAAETYFGAHWPSQIAQGLLGLVAGTARAERLTAVPGQVAAPDVQG